MGSTRPFGRKLLFGLLCLHALCAGTALAAPGDPLGPAIALDTGDAMALSHQPEVARAPDGRFVVVWKAASAGAPLQLRARVYGADGIATSPVLPIYDFPQLQDGGAGNAAVAMDASGGFVIVWAVNPRTGMGPRVLLSRRFDAGGAPLNDEAVVDQVQGGCLDSVDVASNDRGDFAVSWKTWNTRSENSCFSPKNLQLHARSYRADGSARGLPVLVYEAAGILMDLQYGCIVEFGCLVEGEWERTRRGNAIAIDRDGNFVVAWEFRHLLLLNLLATRFVGLPVVQKEGAYVLARRYYANGLPATLATVVDYSPDHYWMSAPDVAMAPDGSWAVAWRSLNPQDDGEMEVSVQRYDQRNQSRGSKIKVGGGPRIDPISLNTPALAMAAGGTLAVAWGDYTAGESFALVRARLLGADGTPVSGVITVDQVRNWTPDPSVAMDAAGNFVIALDRGDAGASVQRFQGP